MSMQTEKTLTQRWRPYIEIFKLALRKILWSRRTILAFMITMALVVFAIVHRFVPHNPMNARRFIPMMTLLFYMQFVTVLIALFFGTGIVADEVDGKTITYLFIRPLRKAWILLSRFLAYLVGTVALITPSHLIATVITATDPKIREGLAPQIGMSFQYIGVVGLGMLVYGAVFCVFGARFKYAVLWGLILAFGWEKITLVVPGNIKKYSAIHYLLSVFPRQNLLREPIVNMLGDAPPSPGLGFLMIFIITAAFLLLAVWIFQRREYHT
jgi:ABC-type transport system involved in multi-copper enzyme maturation permease subunit